MEITPQELEILIEWKMRYVNVFIRCNIRKKKQEKHQNTNAFQKRKSGENHKIKVKIM
jgi:hypothetical protein